MNHRAPLATYWAFLFTLMLSLSATPSLAQQSATAGLPAAGPVAGLPQADAAEDGKKNWLMRTPLVDVPWPEVKMPKLRWKPMGGEKADPAKPGPIARMGQATRNAAQKTRTAWNGAIDKMKVGPFKSRKPQNEQSSFFAKWFGEEEKSQPAETVAEFVGQDRPKFR